MSDYETVLKKLEATPRFLETTNIEKTKELYKSLGEPGAGIPLIHVAGTNGKGSVCNYLTSILRESGFHVGTFISPHLTDIRERILLDGELMEEDTFRELYEYVDEKASGVIRLNHSEYLFLMAMEYYRRKHPDVLILETGLGGRLDITNIVEHPQVCVITRIGLDHMLYLGDTKEKIAREKAGIIKQGVPCICLEQEPEVNRILSLEAGRLQAPLYRIPEGAAKEALLTEKSLTFSYTSRKWGELPVVLKQPALYQLDNAPLAIEALGALPLGENITRQQVLAGLQKAAWPGRMEEILPGIYLDGGHNEDGILSFLKTVRYHKGNKELLFAAASDKDYGKMIRQLQGSGLFDKVVVTAFKGSRATSPVKLKELFTEEGAKNVVCCADTEEAFRNIAKDREAFDGIYIAGSLYLVAEMRQLWKQTLETKGKTS
ncbi:MAG: bifunctional folylpolyglutamate synthase/dihydrofolate synthase [Lachnospiraceae bacterium]|nr:bifunctional folylpolyglutamate synthase/dihydrofolate synthase [Lachnospiraceae bacterium]